MAEALKHHKNTARVATVVVADDVARHWVQAPPAGVASLAELRSVAASRFADLFGEGAEHWSIAGDWHVSRPFVCAAIPRWVTQGLQVALPAQRPVLHSLLGLALKRYGARLPSNGWWCVASPATMTIGCTRHGYVELLRCVGLATRTNEDALRLATRAVRQEAARVSTGTAVEVTWIDLTGATQKSEPDCSSAEHGGMRFTRVPVDLRIGLGNASLDDAASAQANVAATLGTGAAG